MKSINDATIERLVNFGKSNDIYICYLSFKHNYEFKGYESLSQIGKYYTLTINEKKTRLYTMVNFLHKKNIDLMHKITGTKYIEKKAV